MILLDESCGQRRGGFYRKAQLIRNTRDRESICLTVDSLCHANQLRRPDMSTGARDRTIQPFGTATWPKALDHLLAFLRNGMWLKSVLLKERLTIPDYLHNHPVWIHLVVPTANGESIH